MVDNSIDFVIQRLNSVNEDISFEEVPEGHTSNFQVKRQRW